VSSHPSFGGYRVNAVNLKNQIDETLSLVEDMDDLPLLGTGYPISMKCETIQYLKKREAIQ
jgi:hypothetical protein